MRGRGRGRDVASPDGVDMERGNFDEMEREDECILFLCILFISFYFVLFSCFSFFSSLIFLNIVISF